MNIVHCTVGKVNPHGENGVSRVVYHLVRNQRISGHDSQVWSFVDGLKGHETYKRDAHVSIEMFPKLFSIGALKDSMVKHLRKNRSNIDIFHFHMPWLPYKIFVARALRELNIPYVVTAHGAYTDDRIKNVWWTKLPAKYFYEVAFLNRAAAVHAICSEEISMLRNMGVNSPIFVIPNGIDLSEIPVNVDSARMSGGSSVKGGKMKLCWVGILRKDKNLDGLLKAIALLPRSVRKDIEVILVGPEVKAYGNYLRQIINAYNIGEFVRFVGPLFGKAKFDLILNSDIYIQPSHSDVISIAVLEAMACSKPCVISRTCNVSYFYKKNFFCMVEPWPDDIARGIVEMINRKGEWAAMGLRARQIIEEELNWGAISPRILLQYQKLLVKS